MDTVQGYLDRGEIYKKPGEFVAKLALCPSLIGKGQILKDTILRMTALVKRKLDQQRNKKTLQIWLKTVSNDLDTYQVVSREWISEKFWKLPALPVPKEQVYDPTRGKRDVRFFPESEEKLLAVSTDEDLGTELDYDDEEQLLAASPGNQETLCRSSPRSQQLFQDSPRRSPRIRQKAMIQSSPVKKKLPWKVTSKAVSCSPARQSSIRDHSAPKEDTKAAAEGRRTTGSVHFAEKLHELCTTEERGRKKIREQSTSTLSGAYSSHSGERQVREVKSGHPSTSNILKRSSGQGCEELVISTSVLKKARTDASASQLRPNVDDSGDKQKQKRLKCVFHNCWIPGCDGEAKYLKVHAFINHLPTIFNERLNPTDERILRGRRSTLEQAGRWLLRRHVELDQLAAFVVVHKMLSSPDTTEITSRQESAMQEFC